jgi:RND superfamily putative drug exporter
VLGHSVDTTFVVLLTSTTLEASSPEFETQQEAALAPLRSDPSVTHVESPKDVDPQTAATRRSADHHTAFALVTLAGDLKQALGAYPGVRASLSSPTLELTATGRVPFLQNLNATLERDLFRAELISLPLALLVLLLVFRTLVAAVLPIGVGGLAVVGGISVLFALSHAVDISQYAVNVCSLIGLGVAIDYSLFTVARYREELADGQPYEAALVRTVEHSGKVVAFSAMAVGLGLMGLLFFSGSYLMTMGIGGAIVVTLAGAVGDEATGSGVGAHPGRVARAGLSVLQAAAGRLRRRRAPARDRGAPRLHPARGPVPRRGRHPLQRGRRIPQRAGPHRRAGGRAL